MKTIFRQVIASALLFSFQAVVFAQKTPLPAFEKYPADVWAGKPAPLNLGSHRLARKFRTSIREQLQEEGINFAGHYTVAVMGCGTGCSITAIVDARNGRAYFPRVFEGWTSEIGDYQFGDTEDIRTFRVNSRLLRVVGRPRLSSDERWGQAEFIITNGPTTNCARFVSSRPARIPKAIGRKGCRIDGSVISLPLRILRDLCASAVKEALDTFTAETQRSVGGAEDCKLGPMNSLHSLPCAAEHEINRKPAEEIPDRTLRLCDRTRNNHHAK